MHYIMLKDHKPNFKDKPKVRPINHMKNRSNQWKHQSVERYKLSYGMVFLNSR